MQRFKPPFRDPGHTGTLANVQPCLRLTDLDGVGDATHCLRFDMIGLFLFREMPLREAIAFWHRFVRGIGIAPTHVTVHPDQMGDLPSLHPEGVEVRPDTGCVWSDGEIGGYCTELYVGDVEIGNIVNPLSDCLDVGLGLQRLMLVLGEPLPPLEALLENAIRAILGSGYLPGNKAQGYALRRLLRALWRRGRTMDHPVFHDEARRQERLRALYELLLPKHPDRPPEWWFDTHGIVVSDVG